MDVIELFGERLQFLVEQPEGRWLGAGPLQGPAHLSALVNQVLQSLLHLEWECAPGSGKWMPSRQEKSVLQTTEPVPGGLWERGKWIW